MVEFKKLPYKKDEVWICSDLHYAHQNIVRPLTTWQREIEDLDFDCRQFNSLEEMNDQIVNRLNEKVSEEHLLIIVGDIAFGGIQRLYELRGRINCRNVYIVQGNHDHLFDRKPEIRDIFQRYDTIGYYQVEDIEFVCTHHPMLHWHKSHKGSFCFHGHMHGYETEILELIHKKYLTKDVGVDTNELYPYRLDLLVEEILAYSENIENK